MSAGRSLDSIITMWVADTNQRGCCSSCSSPASGEQQREHMWMMYCSPLILLFQHKDQLCVRKFTTVSKDSTLIGGQIWTDYCKHRSKIPTFNETSYVTFFCFFTRCVSYTQQLFINLTQCYCTALEDSSMYVHSIPLRKNVS